MESGLAGWHTIVASGNACVRELIITSASIAHGAKRCASGGELCALAMSILHRCAHRGIFPEGERFA